MSQNILKKCSNIQSAQIADARGDEMSNEKTEKLEKLYELYEQPMYRIAYAVLQNRELSEDAVSDAFLKIIKNLDRIKEPDSRETKSYIIKIIKTTSINQYNRAKRFYSREVSIDDETFAIADKSDIEQEIIGNDNERILQMLNDGDRKLVELRCIKGLAWRDISQIMNISETAARKRFERVRKQLNGVKGEFIDA